MRTLAMALIAGVVLSIAGAPAAAEPSDGSALTAVGGRYNMPLEDFQLIRGRYELDNGETFVLSNIQHRFFGELGNRGSTELVALDDNLFVSAAGDGMIVEVQRFPARVRVTQR
jgi:hypothetical protein